MSGPPNKRAFGFTGFGVSDNQPTLKKPRVGFFGDDDEEKDRRPMKLLTPDVDNMEQESQKPQEEEVDELEAFMAGINQELKSGTAKPAKKLRRDDIEDEDNVESFMKFHQQKLQEAEKKAAQTGKTMNEVLDVEYDSDDKPVKDKRVIDPLPPVDHSKIQYEKINKNFYKPPPNVMSQEEAKSYRKELHIRVSWEDPNLVPAPPCKNFTDFQFEPLLKKAIDSAGYEEPTPIQQQAVPIALQGHDIIAIAKTGSGKTGAFIWPMIVHINDQPSLLKNEGPIGIIISPTRELASQIYLEAKKFAKGAGIAIAKLYGGMKNKQTQVQTLKKGVHIVVATPGRLIEMIKIKVLRTTRASFVVLDEADKMFDMGFEPQIRSIMGQIRPDRQTLLFSATFKRPVEELARDILTNPLRITVGLYVGSANEDITQIVNVLETEEQKWPWLQNRLPAWISESASVLIFCTNKMECEKLSTNINALGYQSAAIHGDKSQDERTRIMFAFKNQNLPILIATDVASRGLDVKSIKVVLNYQCARDIDAHTHRIGRTGRAGAKGIAYTLITTKEINFAALLVENLQNAKQYVSDELMTVAKKSKNFGKKDHSLGFSSGPSKGPKFAGLGFNESSKKGGKSSGLGFVRGTEQEQKDKPPRVLYGDTDDDEAAPAKPARRNSKLASYETMFVDLSGKRRAPTENKASPISAAPPQPSGAYDPSAPTDLPLSEKSAPVESVEEEDPNMKPELAALMAQAKKLAKKIEDQPKPPPKANLLSLLGQNAAPPRPKLFQNKPAPKKEAPKPTPPKAPEPVAPPKQEPPVVPQHDVVTGAQPSRAAIMRDTMMASYRGNFKAASSPATGSLGNFVPASSPMTGFVPASKPMAGFVPASSQNPQPPQKPQPPPGPYNR